MFGLGRTIKRFLKIWKLTRECGEGEDVCDILLEQQNLAHTMRTKIPTASDGTPVPWFTFPAIEYLRAFDARGLDIFEYSCGSSTRFWAGKGANIWSVEHNPEWHDKMLAQLPNPERLFLRTDKECYAKAIHEPEKLFDVIVIDGAWRDECAAEALKRLKPESMVIIDNSDRESQFGVAETFRSNGFFQVDFSGFGPCNAYCWTTSLMLPLQSPFTQRWTQPVPVCGI